jgi:hypothetical protein
MVSKIEPLTAEGKANGRIFVSALMSAPDPLPFFSSLGAAGNGWQENLLRPRTLGAQDHNSDAVMQWRDTPPRMRLSDLKALPNWDTLPVQAAYFKAECKKYYPKLWALLLNPGSRSIATLTADIQDYYEVPNPEYANLDNRIAAATELATVLADLNNHPTPMPQPAPAPKPIPTPSPLPATGVSPVPPVDPAIVAQLLTILAPLAPVLESAMAGIMSGLIKGLVTQLTAQASGASVPPLQLPVAPAAIPGDLLAALGPAIQQMVAAEIAKLNPPKAS